MLIEDFIVHANIGEFARKTAWILQLEKEGKFTSSKAFEEIKRLYIQLENSRNQDSNGSASDA
jgi:hypothetical protein